MNALSLKNGQFDSGDSNNGAATPIPTNAAWTRVATIITGDHGGIIRMDAIVSGGSVNLRLTRAAATGQPHGLLKTDLTTVSDLIPMSTTTGPGTVNQPESGAIVSINIDPIAGAEIGLEAQCVSGTPFVRATGSLAAAR